VRDFSSTPTRKTRSVLRFLVSINAFKSDYFDSLYVSQPRKGNTAWGAVKEAN
jgi:hypothetical protein